MIVKDLIFGYHKECPLMPPLNIELSPGKLHIILGENGRGKSTLLKTLSGHLSPLQGSLIIEKKSIDNWDLNLRSKRIACLFSHANKNLNYSVQNYVALGRSPYTNWLHQLSEYDQILIKEVAEHLEVNHLMSRRISELSDGEFQRVQIAQVLAQDTEYIFLDEVSSHLDLHHKIQLFKLLKTWANMKNKAIVMVSHEINLALEFADHLILLSSNRVLNGNLDQLITDKHIEKLFDSPHLQFDLKSKKFNAVD